MRLPRPDKSGLAMTLYEIATHPKRCIKQKGATHFHCHSNSSEHGRLDEEPDMLDNYPQAYHQPDVMN